MNGFFNEQTYDVALQFDNVEMLYFPLLEEIEMIVGNISCDAGRVDAIADYLEVEAYDYYISGTELPAGDRVIRDWRGQVHWQHLGRHYYGLYLADVE